MTTTNGRPILKEGAPMTNTSTFSIITDPTSSQCITEVVRIIGQQRHVYRKLQNGMEFGGVLDFQGNGTGSLVNYPCEEYLQNCQVKHNVIQSFKSKRNLIGNDEITSRQDGDHSFQTTLHRLYRDYLNRELKHHRIIVFFTQETKMFLAKEGFNQKTHDLFRSMYQDYTLLMIFDDAVTRFAIVIQKQKAYFVYNIEAAHQETVAVKDCQSILASRGYKVQLCACFSDSNASIGSSCILLLLLKALERNQKFNGSDISQLMAMSKGFKETQEGRILCESIQDGKILVMPYDRLLNSLYTKHFKNL